MKIGSGSPIEVSVQVVHPMKGRHGFSTPTTVKSRSSMRTRLPTLLAPPKSFWFMAWSMTMTCSGFASARLSHGPPYSNGTSNMVKKSAKQSRTPSLDGTRDARIGINGHHRRERRGLPHRDVSTASGPWRRDSDLRRDGLARIVGAVGYGVCGSQLSIRT